MAGLAVTSVRPGLNPRVEAQRPMRVFVIGVN